MIREEQEEHTGENDEGDGPGKRDISSAARFDSSSQHHEYSRGGDHREPEKGATDSDEGSLMVRLKRKHIETVGGDVVRGRRKRHQPEDCDGPCKKRWE